MIARFLSNKKLLVALFAVLMTAAAQAHAQAWVSVNIKNQTAPGVNAGTMSSFFTAPATWQASLPFTVRSSSGSSATLDFGNNSGNVLIRMIDPQSQHWDVATNIPYCGGSCVSVCDLVRYVNEINLTTDSGRPISTNNYDVRFGHSSNYLGTSIADAYRQAKTIGVGTYDNLFPCIYMGSTTKYSLFIENKDRTDAYYGSVTEFLYSTNFFGYFGEWNIKWGLNCGWTTGTRSAASPEAKFVTGGALGKTNAKSLAEKKNSDGVVMLKATPATSNDSENAGSKVEPEKSKAEKRDNVQGKRPARTESSARTERPSRTERRK